MKRIISDDVKVLLKIQKELADIASTMNRQGNPIACRHFMDAAKSISQAFIYLRDKHNELEHD